MSTIRYGGVDLPPIPNHLALLIEAQISPRDVYEAVRLNWPGRWPAAWPVPAVVPDAADRGIQLGRLWWPTGASRWAVGHFLAGDEELRHVRRLAYGGRQPVRYVPLTLTLADDCNEPVEADLYLLPPRPLFQVPTAEHLWLLTLVDERFFWWRQAADIVVLAGTTTWSQLLGQIADALGLSLEVDTIDAAYLSPAALLTSPYEYLPPLLDACLRSIGQRLVRHRDGHCETQNPLTAKAGQDDQLQQPLARAGGLFAFNVTTPPHDLMALAAEAVTVRFPRAEDGIPTGDYHAETVTLVSLKLPEYAGVRGHPGEYLFHDLTTAELGGTATPLNLAELQALARQIARDTYRWLLALKDTKYAGVLPYDPEGMSDHIEWSMREADISTRVQRGPWEETGQLMHHGSYGTLLECCGSWSATTGSGESGVIFLSELTLSPTVTLQVPAGFTDSALVITQPGVTTQAFTWTVTATTHTGSVKPPGSNNVTYSITSTSTTTTVLFNTPTTTTASWQVAITSTTVNWVVNYPNSTEKQVETALTTSQYQHTVYVPGDDSKVSTQTTVTTTGVGATWKTPSSNTTAVEVNLTTTSTTFALTTHASQSVDLFTAIVGGNVVVGIDKSGFWFLRDIGTPADGDVGNGELFFGLDDTAGALSLLLKGKDASGNVSNLSLPLYDPGADRIYFWDDSAGKGAYLEAGTGLAITGTTLSATGGAAAGSLQWVKVTKSHTDFQTAATTNTISIYAKGATQIIHAVKVKHSVQFAGTGVTTYTLTGIGNATSTTFYFSLTLALHSAVSDTNGQLKLISTTYSSLDNATSVTASVSCNVNLSNSTAGSLDIWLLISDPATV